MKKSQAWRIRQRIKTIHACWVKPAGNLFNGRYWFMEKQTDFFVRQLAKELLPYLYHHTEEENYTEQ